MPSRKLFPPSLQAIQRIPGGTHYIAIDSTLCGAKPSPSHPGEWDLTAPDGYHISRKQCAANGCVVRSALRDGSCSCAPGDFSSPLVLIQDPSWALAEERTKGG